MVKSKYQLGYLYLKDAKPGVLPTSLITMVMGLDCFFRLQAYPDSTCSRTDFSWYPSPEQRHKQSSSSGQHHPSSQDHRRTPKSSSDVEHHHHQRERTHSDSRRSHDNRHPHVRRRKYILFWSMGPGDPRAFCFPIILLELT